ncbi:MAG: hypothetical protein M0Z38_13335 [Deltaproteobacteria bacterium]|nr:hypothetical protein [Deltaproteobacteria bacterium]
MTISLMLPLVGKTQTDLKRVDKGTGPLSFTRATTATRLNPDTNLIESVASGDLREDGRGYYNRLLYSEDFSQAAWVKTNVAVSNDNVLGPNGKTGLAQTLTASASNGTCLQALIDVSRARYGSIYLKRKTGSGTIQITLDGGSTWTTVAVTGDWTRLGAGQTLANPSFGVRFVTSGDAVYAWGAQVADGSSATRYVRSGANPAYAPLGVLIEGQRTNMIYPSNLGGAGWSNTNPPCMTCTENALIAPDGTLTAPLITATAGDYIGRHLVMTPSFITGHTYNFSFWVKRISGDIPPQWRIDSSLFAEMHDYTQDLTLGEWHRETCTFTADFTGTVSMQLYYDYTTNNTSAWSFWGFQLEEGPFPSSYIPTTSAAVTRNSDAVTFANSGNLSGVIGSLVFECDSYQGTIFNDFYFLDSSSGAGTPILCRNGNYLRFWDGNASTYITERPFSDTARYILVAAWGGGAARITRNGLTPIGAGFSGNQGAGSTSSIGSYLSDPTYFLFGHIKNLLIFNRALFDAEMIAITS